MGVQGNKGALDITRIGRSIHDGTNTRRLSPVPGVLGYEPGKSQLASYNISCDQVKLLQKYVKFARMRQAFYKNFKKVASSPADLAKQFMKAEDAGEIKREGKQRSGGHFDFCAGNKFVHDICKLEKRKPLCNWLTKGVNEHENTHEKQARRDYWERKIYCGSRTSDKDKAKIAAKWEYEAYGEEIKVYERILARLRKELPHCFRMKG